MAARRVEMRVWIREGARGHARLDLRRAPSLYTTLLRAFVVNDDRHRATATLRSTSHHRDHETAMALLLVELQRRVFMHDSRMMEVMGFQSRTDLLIQNFA